MQGGGLSKLTACRCIAFELRQEIMKLMTIANYGATEPVRRLPIAPPVGQYLVT
jgi:hypothetical protein